MSHYHLDQVKEQTGESILAHLHPSLLTRPGYQHRILSLRLPIHVSLHFLLTPLGTFLHCILPSSIPFLSVTIMSRYARNYCPRSSMPSNPTLEPTDPTADPAIHTKMQPTIGAMIWQQHETFAPPTVSDSNSASLTSSSFSQVGSCSLASYTLRILASCLLPPTYTYTSTPRLVYPLPHSCIGSRHLLDPATDTR